MSDAVDEHVRARVNEALVEALLRLLVEVEPDYGPKGKTPLLKSSEVYRIGFDHKTRTWEGMVVPRIRDNDAGLLRLGHPAWVEVRAPREDAEHRSPTAWRRGLMRQGASVGVVGETLSRGPLAVRGALTFGQSAAVAAVRADFEVTGEGDWPVIRLSKEKGEE